MTIYWFNVDINFDFLILTEGILEGLANEFSRIVDERESKSEVTTTVSAAELDELDLKVRSLRTQLRKAEELKNNLQKQHKEMAVKMDLNDKDVRIIFSA